MSKAVPSPLFCPSHNNTPAENKQDRRTVPLSRLSRITYKQEYADGELLIAVEGQVDVNTAPIFAEEIRRIRSEKPEGKIIFDFDRLIYISSAGFRVLLALLETESDRGIRLINVDPVIAEVFDDTGFSEIMEVEVKDPPCIQIPE